MNVSHPLFDVVPGARGRLLYALAISQRAVTRRRLSSIAGVAPGNANRILDELVGSGICHQSEAGRSLMVSLNRQHLASEQILALVALRATLIERLQVTASQSKVLKAAWLFGSVARGDSTEQSDVDVVLVFGDPLCDQATQLVTELSDRILAWTGCELQAIEYSEASWSDLVAREGRLIAEIRRDGIPLTSSSTNMYLRSPT